MVLLNDLKSLKPSSLIYLENFVNDGSPSGFSFVNLPPPDLMPGTVEPIELDLLQVRSGLLVQVGDWPLASYTEADDGEEILAHPTATPGFMNSYDRLEVRRVGGVPAWVTAGGRTFVLNPLKSSLHAKLHYPGVLGRVRRELPFLKAVAGYEVSQEVTSFIENRSRPFGLLREVGLRSVRGVLSQSWDESWSCIIRDGTAYPAYVTSTVLVPAFSLFARDRLAPNDPSLISQLWEVSGRSDCISWVWEEVVSPLIESYLAMTFTLGLMPELNAQNVLLEIGKGVMRPVFRDMGRVEKALHVRRLRGLSTEFISAPYKFIDMALDADYARIRHSFSFDFKLGTYVIEPLLRSLCEATNHDYETAREYVAERNRSVMARDPFVLTCFPSDGQIYGHPKKLLTTTRPYIRLGPAKFR